MKRWYTGNELQAMWDLKPHEWVQAMSGILPPYDDAGRPIGFFESEEYQGTLGQREMLELYEELEKLDETHETQRQKLNSLPGVQGAEADYLMAWLDRISERKSEVKQRIELLESRGIRPGWRPDKEWANLPDPSAPTFWENLKTFLFKADDIRLFAKQERLIFEEVSPSLQANLLQRIMDPNNPNHSVELAVAIKLWEAVYSSGELHIPGDPKTVKKRWIKQQGFADLSDSALERIITVASSSKTKRGGAPPTEPRQDIQSTRPKQK